jgi:hypothetical protein
MGENIKFADDLPACGPCLLFICDLLMITQVEMGRRESEVTGKAAQLLEQLLSPVE